MRVRIFAAARWLSFATIAACVVILAVGIAASNAAAGEGTEPCPYSDPLCAQLCQQGWGGTYNSETHTCRVSEDVLEACAFTGTPARCMFDYIAEEDEWVRMFGQLEDAYCSDADKCDTCCYEEFKYCAIWSDYEARDVGYCSGGGGGS